MPIVPEHVSDLEQLYFKLFPQRDVSDDYKRMVLIAVFANIVHAPGITDSKLRWTLKTKMSIASSDVDRAIAALTNADIFDAISSYSVKNAKKSVCHLRPHKDGKARQDIMAWLSAQVSTYPEFKIMTPNSALSEARG